MNTNVNNLVNNSNQNNNEKVVNVMENMNVVNSNEVVSNQIKEEVSAMFKQAGATNKINTGIGSFINRTTQDRVDTGVSMLEAMFAEDIVLGAGGFGLPVGEHKVTVIKVEYDETKNKNVILTLRTKDNLQTRYTIYNYNKFRTEFFAQTGKEAPIADRLVDNSFTVYSEQVKKGSLFTNKTKLVRSLPKIGAYQATAAQVRVHGATNTLIIDWVINGVTYYDFQVLTADNKEIFLKKLVTIAGAMGWPQYVVISAGEFMKFVPGKTGTMYVTARHYAEANCITRTLTGLVYGESALQIEDPDKAEAALQFLVDKTYNEYKGIETPEINQVEVAELPKF